MKTQIRKFSSVLFLSFISALTFSLLANPYPITGIYISKVIPGWDKLGQQRVDFRLDKDEIKLTAQEGRFRAVKLMVKKAPINMHKCIIHFGNGETQKIDLKKKFTAGSISRTIDLNGGKRFIKKVVLWYDTKNGRENKGIVEVWGKR